MASNIKATPQEEEVPEKQAPETAPDRPLLDLSLPKIISARIYDASRTRLVW